MNATPREEAVRIEVTIGAPIDVVWQALREPDQIRRWHGWHADGLAEEIKLIYETGAHETDRPYVLEVGPTDSVRASGGRRRHSGPHHPVQARPRQRMGLVLRRCHGGLDLLPPPIAVHARTPPA